MPIHGRDCERLLSGAGAFRSLFLTSHFQPFPFTAYQTLKTMKNKPKNVAYIVWVGRTPGIYNTWGETEAQTKGFPGARYKGYTNKHEAAIAWDCGFAAYEAIRSGKRPERDKRTEVPPREPKARKTNPMEAVVAKFNTSPGHGSRTITCTSTGCSYPSCTCGG